MNAANEVSVYAFLEGKIGYLQIVEIVEAVCQEHEVLDITDLESILEADEWARKRAKERIINS